MEIKKKPTPKFIKLRPNEGRIDSPLPMAKAFNLISLRSSLSQERSAYLDVSSQAFLSALEEASGFSFVTNDPSLPSLFFIESGGSETEFIKVYQNYASPYFLLATGDSNSLASSLEILSFVQGHGKKGQIIYGSKEELAQGLFQAFSVLTFLSRFGGATLGLIGKPSDWLIASDVSPAKLLDSFGIRQEEIPFEELLHEIRPGDFKEDERTKEIESLPYKKETVEGALSIYGAIGRIAERRKWSGFSIRCFDLLTSIHNTACLALGLFNSSLFTAACEGDEASLVTMFLLNKLGKPAFQCNPCYVDKIQKKMILAHCTAPLSMFKEKITLMSHFESNEGVGIRGQFLEGDCTVFKLSPSLEEAYVYEGQIIRNLSKENICRSQLEVRFDEDISPLLEKPFGNHLLLVYGHIGKELKTLLPYLNVVSKP